MFLYLKLFRPNLEHLIRTSNIKLSVVKIESFFVVLKIDTGIIKSLFSIQQKACYNIYENDCKGEVL